MWYRPLFYAGSSLIYARLSFDSTQHRFPKFDLLQVMLRIRFLLTRPEDDHPNFNALTKLIGTPALFLLVSSFLQFKDVCRMSRTDMAVWWAIDADLLKEVYLASDLFRTTMAISHLTHVGTVADQEQEMTHWTARRDTIVID
jgi:hypothetical protein